MRGLRQTRYRRPPHRTTSTRAQNIRLGASSRYRRVLAQHRRDSPPAVDPAQLDLAARHKAEEQDERGVFARQGALRLHAASEFSVKSLDRVCRAQRLPLHFGEGEEREELVAAFPQARHHARATFGPRALKRRVSSAGSVSISGVDDAVEVVADLGQHVLGRLTLEIAKLVDAATLYSGAWPRPADGAAQSGVPVDNVAPELAGPAPRDRRGSLSTPQPTPRRTAPERAGVCARRRGHRPHPAPAR